MSLELRNYQAQCVDRAIAANTVVSLPTGKGKTLVAVRVVDHFVHTDVDKHVLFLVPTKPLVSQQAEYCERYCASKRKVAKLSGMEMDSWDEMKWRECLGKFRVLVGTPEVFRRAMDKGFLDPAQLSLLVFDECHNAKGNSPMAALMHDFISKLEYDKCPRILGLTASFFSGSLKRKRDAETAKIELELLLKSKVFAPTVADETSTELGDDEAEKTWERISWDPDNFADKFHSEVMQPLAKVFEELGDVAKSKDLNKMASRMNHVFIQLGKAALHVYIQTCVVRQLQRQMEELIATQVLPPEERAAASALLEKLPVLQKMLLGLNDDLPKLPCVANAPEISRKLLTLHELLRRESLADGKGIVFVEQVAITVPLAQIMNQHVRRKTEAVYGQMTKQDADMILKGFKTGQTRILVSTVALEEGIDVCDCDWVVRFDKFNTTKNHIQGSGRARSSAARIFYFDNDPDEELSKSMILSGIAKDEALSLTEQERADLEDARRPDLGSAKGVYPFEEPGGQEVHLFNCLDIVHDWCQRVLSTSFNAESIYYKENGRLAIRVPAPEGTRSITPDQIDKLWNGVSLRKVIPKERLQTLSVADQEKRRALYVVAVTFRKEGVLDKRNEPDTKRLMLACAKCGPKEPPPVQLSMTSSFGRNALQVKGGNYKTALQELLQQKWKSLTIPNILKYDAVMIDDGWESTIRILPTGESFPSGVFPSKKAAEQDAARKAYEEVTSKQ